MDNKGGTTGEYSTPDDSMLAEKAPDFDEFLEEREDLKPQMERPDEGENVSEEVEGRSVEMPIGMQPDMNGDKKDAATAEVETPALTALKQINIPRDAESLPKSYAAGVVKIIESDKNDPHRLVDDLDVARWDLLRKAYARNLGDGLNGRGGDGQSAS